MSQASSITVEQGKVSGYPLTLRVRGDNWFEVHEADDPETESLRIWYTDWQGRNNLAWVKRTPTGYRFYGLQEDGLGSMVADPDHCTQCWNSDTLKYIAPDGSEKSASIALFQPAVGQPTYVDDGSLQTGSPVAFDAGGLKPAGAVAPVTYQWRFQDDSCTFPPCTHLVNLGTFEDVNLQVVPIYGDPVSGAAATHSWQVGGDFHAQVTATDSQGRTAVKDVVVRIPGTPPQIVLARDCSLFSTPVSCNNLPTQAGQVSHVFATVTLSGIYQWAQVLVDFGDGSGASTQVGRFAETIPGSPITVTQEPGTFTFDLHSTHTYAKAGVYNVTVTAKDRNFDVAARSTVVSIKGPQEISFGQLPDRHYGTSFTASATGGLSGSPVTYTAGPADVCTSDGGTGAHITPVGLGTCTVTANQEGGGPIWGAADPVSRSFQVTPAQLTIRPDNKTKTYGDPNPAYTTGLVGLRNGDTADDFPGLTVTGPPADSDAGSYDLVASGATNPNYTIGYDKGSLQVDRAPLTITPDDQGRPYGGPPPSYTATYDGLVNGDTKADITGLQLQGAPPNADVGTYPIHAGQATRHNYDITYVDGTETVTKVPLKITADDKTRAYGGTTPTYTATFDGLVNGDTRNTVTGLQFSGAPSGALPGLYPIVPSGGHAPDYDLSYVNGTETVTGHPLTITVDDKSKVYGSPDPSFTVKVTGLVGGDTADEVAGLVVKGAPTGSDAGSYPIVASGAHLDGYAITYVNGTETVTKAPLTVTAEDKSKVYGAADPTFTAKTSGLVNGDTADEVTGIAVSGAPKGSNVGTYPIVPSGATSPNYAISYVNGTETITKAPLTVTADNKSKVYGAADPAFTTKTTGLVNGDTAVALTGLVVNGPAKGSNVGTYPIVPSGATSPNYAITYVNGTETITKAALKITADNLTVKFGSKPVPTWKGSGWVNGDTDATLSVAPNKVPKCTATSTATAPGIYAGALACAGAVDANYTVTYAADSLTVDPVITLDQSGLPAALPHKVVLDGQTVNLPQTNVEVGYGSTHSYSFPGSVSGAEGTTYLTSTPAFSGKVNANVNVNAVYQTMGQFLTAAFTSGTITNSNLALALGVEWAVVQAAISSNHPAIAQAALKVFAATVRSQSGKQIKTATANQLIATAQLVYTGAGGKGTL